MEFFKFSKSSPPISDHLNQNQRNIEGRYNRIVRHCFQRVELKLHRSWVMVLTLFLISLKDSVAAVSWKVFYPQKPPSCLGSWIRCLHCRCNCFWKQESKSCKYTKQFHKYRESIVSVDVTSDTTYIKQRYIKLTESWLCCQLLITKPIDDENVRENQSLSRFYSFKCCTCNGSVHDKLVWRGQRPVWKLFKAFTSLVGEPFGFAALRIGAKVINMPLNTNQIKNTIPIFS